MKFSQNAYHSAQNSNATILIYFSHMIHITVLFKMTYKLREILKCKNNTDNFLFQYENFPRFIIPFLIKTALNKKLIIHSLL